MVFFFRTLLLCSLLLPAPLAAETITGEVHWSGQRDISTKVVVAKGATLHIAAGSQLKFTGGSLEITGTLVAENVSFGGNNWPGIVLYHTDQRTQLRGSRISGAETGIFVAGGNPQFEQLTLHNNQVGIELKQQSRATLRDCRFEKNAKVGLFIKEGSTPVVTGNQFVDNGKYGAYIYRSNPARFHDNQFTANATGLMIAYYGSDPLITGNTFSGNQIGIYTDRSAKPRLQGNRLSNNQTGIKLQRRSDALVKGNLLQDNRQGIAVLFSSYPQIVGNDFLGNEMALYLEHQSSDWERVNGAASRQQEVASRGAFGVKPRLEVSEQQRSAKDLDGTVDARGNWWGEESLAELQQVGKVGNLSFIHDGNDQANFRDGDRDYPLDRVTYFPAALQAQFLESRQ